MVYADVIVAARGSSEQLTYAVPAQIIPYIRVGCLVVVPIRQKKVKGVVTKIHRRVESRLKGRVKEIISIDRHHPGLSAAQLAVANRLASNYLTHPSDIIFRLLSTIRAIAIPAGGPSGRQFFLQAAWGQRVAHYLEQSKKYAETLILFPTNAHLADFRQSAEGNVKTLVLDGTAKTRRAISAPLTDNVVFLGTVGDSFFPLRPRSLIIVDQPEHIGSRYSNRPPLKAADVAACRQELEGVNVLFGQVLLTPKQIVETQREKVPTVFKDAVAPAITVFSRLGGRDLLLPSLLEKISQGIAENKRVCLFVASKGWSSGYFCRNCQTLCRCPKCQRVIGAESDRLLCRFCSHSAGLPKQCTNCGKSDFAQLGEGIDKIHDELRQHFPKVAMQVIAGAIKNVDSKVQITIATEKVLSFPQLSFDILGVVSADRALSGSALDDQWRLLTILRELSTRSPEVLIQTFLPDNRVWSALNPQNIRTYFTEELTERKRYALPPYTQNLKLTGQSVSGSTIEKQVEELEEYLTKNFPAVDFYSSQAQSRDRRQVQMELQIISPKEKYPALIKKLAEVLPPNWWASK